MNSDAIYDWVFLMLPSYGATRILCDTQSVEMPETAFVTFGIGDSTRIGYGVIDSDIIDDDTDRYVEKTRIEKMRTVVSINIYNSDTAREDLMFLDSSSHRQDVIELMDSNACALLGLEGSIRNLSFLGDTTYRTRYQADFVFNENVSFGGSNAESLDVIDEYDVGGEADNDTITITASRE